MADTSALLRLLSDEKRSQSMSGRREALTAVRTLEIEREEIKVRLEKCQALMMSHESRVIHPYIAKLNRLRAK